MYIDGHEDNGSKIHHSAWHASVFPGSFGMIPEQRWKPTLEFLREKGMTGSVYGAFAFLRALYYMDLDRSVGAVYCVCTGHIRKYSLV